MQDSNFIKLSVSGRDYRIRLSKLLTRLQQRQQFEYGDSTSTTLTRLELLALAKTVQERAALVDEYISEIDAFSLERSPMLFEYILDFHRTGQLHAPNDVCPTMFLQELEFWKISREDIADCCGAKLGIEKRGTPEEPRSPRLNLQRGNITHTSEINSHLLLTSNSSYSCPNYVTMNCVTDIATMEEGRVVDQMEMQPSANDLHEPNPSYAQFNGAFFGRRRLAVWKFFEDPTSSYGAKVFTVFSIGFVVTSVLCLIVASLQALQEWNHKSGQYEPIFILRVVEYVCIAWFTFDFVTRFLIVVHKVSFLKETMNIIDILSIVPFYIEFIFEWASFQTSDMDNIKGALLVMRVLRVLRVMRLFRLARYSGGLKSIGQTISSSKKEISMLVMFISTTIILFSTMVYFFEKDVENTKFTSIPATFWWCIATMTTVGYGDLVPKTFLGKLVASVTSVSGVIVLAFPITMIVENFNKCYRKDEAPPSPTNSAETPTKTRIHRFGFL